MVWKGCKIIFLFIVATIFHWAGATLFSFFGLSVNLMLVFAIAFCAELKLEVGYPVAFMAGLFLDFFGTRLFGNNAFSFTAAACLMYALRSRFDFESIFPQVFTVFGLTCFVSLLNSILLAWFTSAMMWPGTWSVVGGAAVGAAFAPFVFWLANRVLREDTKAA